LPEVRPDGADQLLGGLDRGAQHGQVLGRQTLRCHAIACTAVEPVGATDRQ
jgi:hypothetical protein